LAILYRFSAAGRSPTRDKSGSFGIRVLFLILRAAARQGGGNRGGIIGRLDALPERGWT
jgi:hypothetical protein